MAFIRSIPHVDRETLIKTVRATIKAAGGRSMTMRKFLACSGMRPRDIFKHYTKWAEVLREAGATVEPPKMRLDPEVLLADWGEVVRKVGHCPSQREYGVHGKFNPNTVRRRIADWRRMPEAFRKFAGKKEEWADVIPLIEGSEAEAKGRSRGWRPNGCIRKVPRLADRPACGVPIDFGPLRHAPVNEDGVIFLFGMLAEKLGFIVEAFQSGFPDCQAKRRVTAESWQNVAIEFEYESRNFRDHGHVPEGCDMIVCWRHNWVDCPERLQVIALEEEMGKVRSEGGKWNGAGGWVV
jgi:hypothetical protein